MNLPGPATSFAWNYDRAEIVADGVIHTIGVVLGVIGAAVVLAIAFRAARNVDAGSTVIYVIGLLSMLGLSAAYNLWPACAAQMAAAPLRPFGDLFADCRHLYQPSD